MEIKYLPPFEAHQFPSSVLSTKPTTRLLSDRWIYTRMISIHKHLSWDLTAVASNDSSYLSLFPQKNIIRLWPSLFLLLIHTKELYFLFRWLIMFSLLTNAFIVLFPISRFFFDDNFWIWWTYRNYLIHVTANVERK